jgi:YbgC/YbaW family acyl-CoA thioester hydrolase
MTASFTRTFRVRSYELRADGAVGHAVFLHWFQEAAFEASSAGGYGPEEYAAMGAAWVMRGVDIEFLAPAHYGDEATVTTWVSDFRRVRSHREYEARRTSDGLLLARARADWVFLDVTTMAPRRITPAMVAAFAPNNQPALQPMSWPEPAPEAILGSFESERRVQHYELDQMRHVNNAIYLNWIEQQAREAWRTWGGRPDALDFRRHQIEYRQAALDGDRLTLVSQAGFVGETLIWHHRVLRDEAVLVEARSLGARPTAGL